MDMSQPAPDALGADSPLSLPSVMLRAPGRLHLGFLDPAGTLGRRFGSLGLVVDGLETVVELQRAGRDEFSAADAACADELPRARAHLESLRRATGQATPLHLHIAQTMLGRCCQRTVGVDRAIDATKDVQLPRRVEADVVQIALRQLAR